jgi:hypothetical protein
MRGAAVREREKRNRKDVCGGEGEERKKKVKIKKILF